MNNSLHVPILSRVGLAMYDVYEANTDRTPLVEVPFPASSESLGSGVHRAGERDGKREMELRTMLHDLSDLKDADDTIKALQDELALICKESCEAEVTIAEASGILQLSGPFGLATDGNGHIIVLDWARERLQVISNDGTFVVSCLLSASGVGGGYTYRDRKRADMMLEPSGAVIDDRGQIAAINSDMRAVVVYCNEPILARGA